METRMITDYTAQEFDDLDKLAEWVKIMIADGWQPLGGVSAYAHIYNNEYDRLISDDWYAQAMVKVEK